MKKKMFVLLIIVFQLSLTFQTSADPFIYGIVAGDGSAIQIIQEKEEGHFVYIPQDKDVLEIEEFWIFIDARDSKTRSIELSMFVEESKTIAEYDPDSNDYTFRNITSWTKQISNLTIKMKSGDNIRGDPRYGLKFIDSSIWTSLKAEDRKSLIRVEFVDLTFDFFHRTNYAFVPIVQTRLEANLFAMYQLGFLLFALIIAIIASSFVYEKVGNVWPKVSLSILMLAFTWFVLSVFGYYFGITKDISEAMRRVFVFPLEIVSLVIAFWAFFFIPSRYRPKIYGESLFVALDIPYQTTYDFLERIRSNQGVPSEIEEFIRAPIGKWEILYKYFDKKGNRVYARDPDSIWDFLSRLIFGGIRIPYKNLFIVYGEDKRDEIIFCTNFDEKEETLFEPRVRRLIYSVLGAGLFVSFFTSFFFNWVFLIFSLFLVALIGLWLYERFEAKHLFTLDPLNRDVLSAMYDSAVVWKLSKTLQYVLHQNEQLHREKYIDFFTRLSEFFLDWEKRLFPDSYFEEFGDIDEVREIERDQKNKEVDKWDYFKSLQKKRKSDLLLKDDV